jgi:RNA-binding protein
VSVTLNGKQKRFLRALAHSLKPVVQIGQAGLTPSVLSAIDAALGAHELIKVKLGGEGDLSPDAVSADIERETDSAVAQVIGRVLVVYRPRPEEPRIELPRERPPAGDEK